MKKLIQYFKRFIDKLLYCRNKRNRITKQKSPNLKYDSLETFIQKAKKVHGDKYNYSKVNYINSKTKVIIICPEHGEFIKEPRVHLQGQGCPKCNKITTNIFIERAKKLYGNKYDYSKSIYKSTRDKVIITCPIHGDFLQSPNKHLSGQGCPKCGKQRAANKQRRTTGEFIKLAKQIHGDKYSYNKVNYINNCTAVEIVCPVHGSFFQLPTTHINNHGDCPKCKKQEIANIERHTIEKFIELARQVHGDKYNYDKSVYVNYGTPLIITCFEHGDFLLSPRSHISKGCGCPQCNNNDQSRLEEQIYRLLTNNSIVFETEKTWDWLIFIKNQFVDFYLPEYKLIIECQGKQHFEGSEFFRITKEEIMKRDKNKLIKCQEHGINVLYFSNLSTSETKYQYPYLVYEDENLLLQEILKHKRSD